MIGSVTNAGALAIAVVITAACASTAGLRSEPLDAGETKFYSAPLAVVGPAARQAVLSAGLNVDTVSTPDSLTWMIIAKKGMSLFSYGELVRVVVAADARSSGGGSRVHETPPRDERHGHGRLVRSDLPAIGPHPRGTLAPGGSRVRTRKLVRRARPGGVARGGVAISSGAKSWQLRYP